MFSAKPTPETQQLLPQKVGQVTTCALVAASEALSEPKKGLLQVMNHVQDTTPGIVQGRYRLQELQQQFQALIEEAKDVAKVLEDMNQEGCMTLDRIHTQLDNVHNSLRAKQVQVELPTSKNLQNSSASGTWFPQQVPSISSLTAGCTTAISSGVQAVNVIGLDLINTSVQAVNTVNVMGLDILNTSVQALKQVSAKVASQNQPSPATTATPAADQSDGMQQHEQPP